MILLVKLLDFTLKIIALMLNKIYGYEALNILLKNIPSKKINYILRLFGARIGRNVSIKSPFLIHNADELDEIYSNLIIGDDCYIGRDCIFDLKGKIVIENSVTISHRALLNTHIDTGNSIFVQESYSKKSGNILIGSGTYLGTNVTILHSVKIGSNSIIGSSSLVNKDISDNVRAFGIPCKENKKLI